jgi:hypothetical protein
MDWRWSSALVALLSAACLLGSARIPASRIVAGATGPELDALEARVSSSPTDAEALAALVGAYLERRAPGLAQAALDRAPEQVREIPAIADARVRTLSALGRADIALDVQRRVLASCAEQNCSPTLRGRAEHRARVLDEMVRMGALDPKHQPELALIAYRRATRVARLEAE